MTMEIRHLRFFVSVTREPRAFVQIRRCNHQCHDGRVNRKVSSNTVNALLRESPDYPLHHRRVTQHIWQIARQIGLSEDT